MSIRSPRIRSASWRSLRPTLIAPLVGQGLELRGERVGRPHVGVAHDLDLAAIVVREQGEQEPSDGVAAEVGRDVADSQLPIGRAVVRVGTDLRRERLGVPPGPLAMLGEERLGIVVGMIMQGEEVVARRLGEIGLQLDRPAETSQCLIDAALLLQGVAQVAVRGGVAGPEPDGPVKGVDRLVEPALIPQGIAQVVVRGGVGGPEPDGPVEGGDRFLEPALVLQAQPRLLWASTRSGLSAMARR